MLLDCSSCVSSLALHLFDQRRGAALDFLVHGVRLGGAGSRGGQLGFRAGFIGELLRRRPSSFSSTAVCAAASLPRASPSSTPAQVAASTRSALAMACSAAWRFVVGRRLFGKGGARRRGQGRQRDAQTAAATLAVLKWGSLTFSTDDDGLHGSEIHQRTSVRHRLTLVGAVANIAAAMLSVSAMRRVVCSCACRRK